MKKVITFLLAFMLMISSISFTNAYATNSVSQDDISLYSGEINFDDGVTRAEWLTALTRAYQMEVEDDSYPDNYFNDLDSTSPFYYDLLLAVNFGLVDVEAGGSLYPNDFVTKEFAAHTLNYCVGYQNESEEYAFIDHEDVIYLDDVQVSIEQGWLHLVNDQFMPNELITSSEALNMIEIAETTYTSTQIDTNHENIYDFADDVIVFDENVIASYQDQIVSIDNTEIELNVGDKYSVYLNGIPVIFEATEIKKENNKLIVTSEEIDMSEGFDNIDAQGEMDISEIQVGEVEGLDITYEEEAVTPYMARGVINVGKNNKLKANGKLKLIPGVDIKIDYELQNGRIEYGMNSKNGVFLKFSGYSKYTYGIEGDITKALNIDEVTILPATIPGVGGLDIIAEFSASGSICGKNTGYITTGVSYNVSSGFRYIREFKSESFQLLAEVQGEAGIKVRLGITGKLPVKGYIWGKIGGAAKVSESTYSSGTPSKCRTVAAWMYAAYGATVSVEFFKYSKSFSIEQEIYDEYNSPIRVYHHYEDGKEVCTCSRNPDSFIYYTPATSNYYGNGWINGAGAYGYGTNGEIYTIYDYELDDNHNATITKYYGNARSLSIPKTIDGYIVVSIGSNAFSQNNTLISIVIPDTVTTINSGAFSFCSKLKEIELPLSLEYLGGGAFKECDELEYVFIPKSVQDTEDFFSGMHWYSGVFYGCDKLKNVEFEEGITKIPASLFANCPGLEEIVIPDTVTHINYQAFYNCDNLNSVVLPDSLTNINGSSFSYTPLISIDIPDTVTTIDSCAFSFCSKLKEIELPLSLEYLGGGAFKECDELEYVFIPKSVQDTEDFFSGMHWYSGVFYGCDKLKNVEFEEGITKIPASLFANCPGLEETVIPDTVTHINYQAFYNCDNLNSVVLPDTVTTIDSFAFSFCSKLKEIELPLSLEYLGGGAFNECDELEYVFIPKSVQDTEDFFSGMHWYSGVFYGCDKLKNVEFEEGITKIPASLFANCPGLEEIVIPDTVTHINDQAFYNCVNMNTIKLSNALTVIDVCAFQNAGLNNIEIPNTLTEIGKKAFCNTKLVDVYIPNNVKNIGDNVFMDCTELKSITLPNTTINIPTSLFENCEKLESITLPDTVERIRDNAFKNCVSLKNVKFNSKLKVIGNSVFNNCDALINVELPKSVIDIGSNVFYDCDQLKEVKIYTGLDTISKSMFEHCDVLESITLPYGIKNINENSFKNCVNLTSITIPRTVNTISSNAFSYYDQLTIYGVEDTYAETFANENGATFVAINKPATQVTLNKTTLMLNEFSREQLFLTIDPIDFTDEVAWKSSNTDVIEVNEEGVVEAVGVGDAIVKVVVGNKSVSCSVKVVKPVRRIYLDEYYLELQGGDTYQLTAEIYPDDAYNKNIKWSSSDEKVVTVNQSGEVRAVSKGSAIITVEALDGSGVTKTCEVVVLNDVIMITDLNKLESSHNYLDDNQDIYVYKVNGSSSLDVTFDSRTNVEDGFDYIKIFDKNNNLVGEYTGSELAGKTVKIQGDTVKIQLISDEAGNEWGFKVIKINNITLTDKTMIFRDVPTNAWFYGVVEKAYTKGLMSNTGKGKEYFEPDAPITRGMVATVLHRMAKNPKVTFTNKFPDVKKGVWYSNAIIWAAENKVVSGNKDGSYAPDKEITRQDLAIMLRNYAASQGLNTSKVADLTPFLDDDKVASYAKSAIAWCVEAKLMSGAKTDKGSKLNPQANASRAECAKMFSLLDDLIK